MEVNVPISAVALRSSTGIEVWGSLGSKMPYEVKHGLPREETKHSKAMCFSSDGQYFACSTGREIKVFRTTDWQLQCILPRPRALYVKFSPRGTFLCTWELYIVSKDVPEKTPNLYFYDVKTGNEVFGMVQKMQTHWEPSWSPDESTVALMVGGEIFFYDNSEDGKGFQSPMKRIGGRHGLVSMSPSKVPFVALYTPGVKGSPSICKLYKYPYIGLEQAIACKSFYNADHVEILWNNRGNGLLILTSTDVDKSGASYYGNQSLHFLGTKGDSCSVVLSKTGPVHCVKWSPKATEFIVVYGYVPMKATLFNIKCDPIFEFGEGPRNAIFFNPFGNVVVLAGFGNLPGHVEVWDVEKQEKLANMKCTDTTYFEWHPNGEYFLTATTAPRLRIGNGFNIYHYSGALMQETIWPSGQELYGVLWKPFPKDTFTAPTISKVKQIGIKSSQPEASKKVYTPPHLRLMKEGKDPVKFVPQLQPTMSLSSNKKEGVEYPAGSNNVKWQSKKTNKKKNNPPCDIDNELGGLKLSSKNTNKFAEKKNLMPNDVKDNFDNAFEFQRQHSYNRKNKLLHTAKKELRQEDTSQLDNNIATMEQRLLCEAVSSDGAYLNVVPNVITTTGIGGAAILDKQALIDDKTKLVEKKSRNVMKKLQDIQKLKARQDQGELLQLNQLQKIANEPKLIEELRSLEKSA